MRSIVTAGILTVGSCIGSSSPSLLMILGGSCPTRGNWLFNKVLLRLWLLLLVPILRRVWQESLFHEPPHWLIERNRGCSGLRTGNFTLIVQLSDNLSSRLRWSYTVIFALFRLLTCPYPQWELSNQLLRGLGEILTVMIYRAKQGWSIFLHITQTKGISVTWGTDLNRSVRSGAGGGPLKLQQYKRGQRLRPRILGWQ